LKLKEFLHKSQFNSLDGLGMEFRVCKSELMPELALTSFTVFDSYSYFVGQ